MFNLDQIMHFFTNNITNIITISSPVILIIKYFLICRYKSKCEQEYGIPKELFEVNFWDNILNIIVFIVLATLMITIKRQDGIQYTIVQCIGLFAVTFLFTIEIYGSNLKILNFIGMCLLIIKIISEIYFKSHIAIINGIFILYWVVLLIFFICNNPKYYIDRQIIIIDNDNKESMNCMNVILSNYKGGYIVAKGKIDNDKNLIIYTNDYKILNPIQYRIEKITGYKNINIKNEKRNN